MLQNKKFLFFLKLLAYLYYIGCIGYYVLGLLQHRDYTVKMLVPIMKPTSYYS